MSEETHKNLILIVDDSTENLQVISSLLQEFPYDLMFANDGEEALNAVEENPPDLILMDLMMPRMDGLEACRRIKEQKHFQDIPIIFLTASNESHNLSQAFRLGASDYVSKPFRFEELLSRIRTHLKSYQNIRSLRELNGLLKTQQHEINIINDVLNQKNEHLESLSNELARYVSPQISSHLRTGLQTRAPHRKKLTIFFSDICGFTEISDSLEPEVLARFVNDYFNEMVRIALDHGATIDKFIGDALMVFFGDPESLGVAEDAIACARMALAMRDRIAALAGTWDLEGLSRPLQVRMGIHTGYCTVGNFGSEDKLDYTIIGSPVNLASRLETSAKAGEILISHSTWSLIASGFECEPQEAIAVKGFKQPVNTYKLVSELDPVQTEISMLKKQVRHILDRADEDLTVENLKTILTLMNRHENR